MRTLLNGWRWIYRRKIQCLAILAAWLVMVGVYHTFKPLPPGVGLSGKTWAIPESDIRFLSDLTYVNENGDVVYEQEIFDTVFDVIENAKYYILIDMFLFNSQLGRVTDVHRQLSGEMVSLLLRKKSENPNLRIDIITDDINNAYGGAPSDELATLQEAGANVIITNHKPLRDSNFIYSSLWRTFVQWFGNQSEGGMFPHPFSASGNRVTLRSYLTLLNFKANHRKIILADSGDRLTGLVLSANCHDASSAHSNVAFLITGDIWKEIYDNENALAFFSGSQLNGEFDEHTTISPDENSLSVRALGEIAIKNELIHHFNETGYGDSISIAMFYLAEKDIIKSLLAAHERGVFITMILDPSKDAFGYEKHGIPNRPVAEALQKKSGGGIQIRWSNTHGEQFHTKLVLIRRKSGAYTAMLGSANLTRRNIGNYNLELDVEVSGTSQSICLQEVSQYFDRIWSNKDGNQYTLDYEHYRNTSFVKALVTKAYESFGLSTF